MKFSISEIMVATVFCSACFALTNYEASQIIAAIGVAVLVALPVMKLNGAGNYFRLLIPSLIAGCILVLVGTEVLSQLLQDRIRLLTPMEEALQEERLFSVGLPIGALLGSAFTFLMWKFDQTNRLALASAKLRKKKDVDD